MIRGNRTCAENSTKSQRFSCAEESLMPIACPDGVDGVCRINRCNCKEGYKQTDNGIDCQKKSQVAVTLKAEQKAVTARV